MDRLFGTDGVRGLANKLLTPELAFALGRALGGRIAAARTSPGAVLVGRDPRPSSEMLEAALCAGICSTGTHVWSVGVVPTAAVAFLTELHGAAAGAIVTASHNPLDDNGFKFFDGAGWKFSYAEEYLLEQIVRGEAPDEGPRPTGIGVGRVRDKSASVDAYVAHLLAGIPDLSGIRVALDCANGATAILAPEVYKSAGAGVREVASDLSGELINEGVGATNIEHLVNTLAEAGERGTIGLAHDGDGDRLIGVDEQRRVVDGSAQLAVFAIAAKRGGGLAHDTIVTTPMSNSGLAPSLAKHGIRVVNSEIGDRAVVARMRDAGYNLGGEHYGHIVFLDRATTGDGILTGLRLMAEMAGNQSQLEELGGWWEPRPQVLVNVRVADRASLDRHPEITRFAEARGRELNGSGRLLVRMSTIEPVIRVMCEADRRESAARIASDIRELLEGAE